MTKLQQLTGQNHYYVRHQIVESAFILCNDEHALEYSIKKTMLNDFLGSLESKWRMCRTVDDSNGLIKFDADVYIFNKKDLQILIDEVRSEENRSHSR